MEKISLFWFRRDLRLEDNHALYRALSSDVAVLPIFIFDKELLSQIEFKDDARVSFIYDSVSHLHEQLQSMGSTLVVMYGDVLEVFKSLLGRFDVVSVYVNSDYEHEGMLRDWRVEQLLSLHGISFYSYKDHVLFEKNEIVKQDGTPYRLFSAYARVWLKRFSTTFIEHYASEHFLDHFVKGVVWDMPSLESFGFRRSTIKVPPLFIKPEIISHYDATRNYPWMDGTSRLSVYLRFGTLSVRSLSHLASELNAVFLSELIWRDFFMMLLYFFPNSAWESFKKRYSQVAWSNNMHHFRAWCEGKTGYALVDAGMRELNATGLMHGRVRMVAASFLVKNLRLDWRLGEHYFAQHLLDYEMSSNVGNWQWIAGTGIDSMPIYRVFNPLEQARKYDAKGEYVTRWLGDNYAMRFAPIVNLKQSKQLYNAMLSHESRVSADDMD